MNEVIAMGMNSIDVPISNSPTVMNTAEPRFASRNLIAYLPDLVNRVSEHYSCAGQPWPLHPFTANRCTGSCSSTASFTRRQNSSTDGIRANRTR